MIEFNGIGVSDGIGIGKVCIVGKQTLEYENRENCNPEEEAKRYKSALKLFCENTEKSAERLKKSVGEKEAEILSGHISMLRDPYLNGEIERLIRDGKSAETAVSVILDMFYEAFSGAEDELTRQRAADVGDVKSGMLSILLGKNRSSLTRLPANSVIVAEDLTPSEAAGLDKNSAVGIITETGGRTSHCAILARAMGIPAVMSAEGITDKLSDGQDIIVDGTYGKAVVAPSEAELSKYREKQEKYIKTKADLLKFKGRETVTADNKKIELFCNIGTPDGAVTANDCGGEGVGLFRTEFLFMDRESAPDEEEQFEAYKKAALIMKNKPVIIRTLDVGGDKNIPYLNLKKEENPFLGFRAVRYCLKNADLFKTQLRAILRASDFGDIRIMLPLVTSVSEVRKVKDIVREIGADLKNNGVTFNEEIKLGVMIETPAASLIADLLAGEADFFSIGSNDLTGYTLSADRGNSDVAYMCNTLHPAVLRSIKNTIECANRAGIPVGMCGEAAADKRLIPLLISFGLREFSVSPSEFLSVRKEIAQWSKPLADEIANDVMSMNTAEEIEKYFACLQSGACSV